MRTVGDDMDSKDQVRPPSAIERPCFVFRGDLLLLRTEPEPELPSWEDIAGLPFSEQSPRNWMTGRPGNHWVSLREDEAFPGGMELVSLRDIWSLLGERTFFEAGRAFQLMEWSRRNRFCGRCATPMREVENETALECPSCGLLSYPPVTPAIIVAVVKDGKLLLARNSRFPKGRYSVIAGFVEPGETLEGAVEREVMEEVSIRVKNIAYFGSQPWPFPHSMMVGFRAEWKSGEIKADGDEIESAAWFSPDCLPNIPPSLSISRRLIDDYLARHA